MPKFWLILYNSYNYIISYQLKLINMRAKLGNQSDCEVSFLLAALTLTCVGTNAATTCKNYCPL